MSSWSSSCSTCLVLLSTDLVSFFRPWSTNSASARQKRSCSVWVPSLQDSSVCEMTRQRPVKTYRPVSLAVTLISAYFSDRYNARALPTALISSMAVAGFALYLSTSNAYLPRLSLVDRHRQQRPKISMWHTGLCFWPCQASMRLHRSSQRGWPTTPNPIIAALPALLSASSPLTV